MRERLRSVLGLFAIVVTVLSTVAVAAERYAVVVGNYGRQSDAEIQRTKLEREYGKRQEIAALKEANGFAYEVVHRGKYYVVRIAPISGERALRRMLTEARRECRDAYVVPLGNSEPSGVAVSPQRREVMPDRAEAVKEKPTIAPESEAKPEAVPAQPLSIVEAEWLYYAGAALAVLILFRALRRKKRGGAETLPQLKVVEPEPAKRARVEAERAVPTETVQEKPLQKGVAAPEPIESAGAEVETEIFGEPESLRQKRRYCRGTQPIGKERFSDFAGARILVAEDNLINQKVISSLLAGTGIDVVIASDGKETLELLAREGRFDMVLMDLHMPVMDGYEATQAIRENREYGEIPVIALSGDTGNEEIKAMYRVGMDGHLEKPLHLDALYEAMYNFIDLKRDGARLSEGDSRALLTEKGLEICMGDEALYKEILSEFSAMYAASDDALRHYLALEQWDEANAMLLDIRGVAANIGADRLAATAEELREALMNREAPRYNGLSEMYSRELGAVLEAINGF